MSNNVKNTMMSMMHKMIFSCSHATFLISRSIHQNLSYAEKQRLKMHLIMCRNCREYKRNILLLDEGIRKMKNYQETKKPLFTMSDEKKSVIIKVLSNRK